jgi:hypothetical protein
LLSDRHRIGVKFSDLPNSGDRRLSGIANTGLAAGQYSNYTFTTTPENFISGITETSDAPSVYPAAGTQTASYNNLNQLTSLSGQALSFDAAGNLTSDGQRSYTWDAYQPAMMAVIAKLDEGETRLRLHLAGHVAAERHDRGHDAVDLVLGPLLARADASMQMAGRIGRMIQVPAGSATILADKGLPSIQGSTRPCWLKIWIR